MNATAKLVWDGLEFRKPAVLRLVEPLSDARFGVVVFSAPSGRNGAYNSYWLFRDRDLTQAYFFSRAVI